MKLFSLDKSYYKIYLLHDQYTTHYMYYVICVHTIGGLTNMFGDLFGRVIIIITNPLLLSLNPYQDHRKFTCEKAVLLTHGRSVVLSRRRSTSTTEAEQDAI